MSYSGFTTQPQEEFYNKLLMKAFMLVNDRLLYHLGMDINKEKDNLKSSE